MLEVILLSPASPIFEGTAERVIMPGEKGVFEIFSFHRPLVSRLLPGLVVVDDRPYPIRRGVVKVDRNRVTALVEPT